MFLSSINHGIIQVWRRPINPSLMKQFLDIISKIPLEMSWLAEGKTSNLGMGDFSNGQQETEAWMIKRVSTTNYFIAGRATSKDIRSEDWCSSNISLVFEEVSDIIEKSLEKEWLRMSE